LHLFYSCFLVNSGDRLAELLISASDPFRNLSPQGIQPQKSANNGRQEVWLARVATGSRESDSSAHMMSKAMTMWAISTLKTLRRLS
jgi:hypothetical protein